MDVFSDYREIAFRQQASLVLSTALLHDQNSVVLVLVILLMNSLLNRVRLLSIICSVTLNIFSQKQISIASSLFFYLTFFYCASCFFTLKQSSHHKFMTSTYRYYMYIFIIVFSFYTSYLFSVLIIISPSTRHFGDGRLRCYAFVI